MEAFVTVVLFLATFLVGNGIHRHFALAPGQKGKNVERKLKIILLVKNQQDIIEGLVRGLFRLDVLRRSPDRCKITVVDCSSEDETLGILERLKGRDEDIEVVRESGLYNEAEGSNDPCMKPCDKL